VASPEGLGGWGVDTEVAATAFATEQGGFDQLLSQHQPLVQVVGAHQIPAGGS